MSTIKSPRGDTLSVLVDLGSLTENLTGSTFFITAKRSINDNDSAAPLKAQHTCTNNANFFFTFSHTDTQGLDPTAEYICDVQQVRTDGSVETWPTFRMKFSADVTIRTS